MKKMNEKGAGSLEIMIFLAIVVSVVAGLGIFMSSAGGDIDKNSLILKAKQAAVDAKKFIEQENTDILPVYEGKCLIVRYSALSSYDSLEGKIELDDSYVLLYQKSTKAKSLSAIVHQQNKEFQIKFVDQDSLNKDVVESGKFEKVSLSVGDKVTAKALNNEGNRYDYECVVQWIY